MNDETPDPLAEELAALRPHDPSPAFRRRLAESLTGPRPVTSRWPWVVTLAGGLAAAVLAAVLLRRGGDTGVVATRAIVKTRPGPAVQAEDAMPTLQAYRQALARSPEDLDALLDKHAARAPGPDPRLVRIHALTPSDRELQALTGDL